MKKLAMQSVNNKLSNAEKQLISMELNEPITWSIIALEIGKGVLGAIGAKIFNDLFNKGVDLEKLMENMLRETDKIVKERIKEAYIKAAVDKAKATDLAIRQYLNSPTKERLDYIWSYSLDLVTLLKDFKHRTYSEYILSAGFQLIALEEMFKTNHKERKNIIEFLKMIRNQVIELNSEWRNLSDNRFRKNKMGPFGYAVFEANKIISNFSDNKTTTKLLQKIRNERYEQDVVIPFIKPSEELIKLWNKRIFQLEIDIH